MKKLILCMFMIVATSQVNADCNNPGPSGACSNPSANQSKSACEATAEDWGQTKVMCYWQERNPDGRKCITGSNCPNK